ncbi:hypothetical protein GCM10023100_75220 [Actinocorallia cavernae]|uniref:Secreted protein n=2 Tax=Actinomycetes TaxID=1760 RepID=A0ABP5XXT0_9ACTN
MTARLGRTWLIIGVPTMAIWAGRPDAEGREEGEEEEDKRTHSFLVYGERGTADRRADGTRSSWRTR